MLLQHQFYVIDEYIFVVIIFFNKLCPYSVLNSAYVQNMLCLSFWFILSLFSIK